MSSADPTHSRPLTEATRHARQNRVLARLIGKASSAGSPLRVRGRDSKPEQSLESWLGQAESTERLTVDHDSQSPIRVSDSKLHHAFQEIATMLYKMRRRLPTHPNYQRWTADPQVRTKLDAEARDLFEYLTALKKEITNRAQGSNSTQQLEAEEAWNGLIRDLQFKEATVKEHIQTAPDDDSIQGSSVSQVLASSTSAPQPGTVPEEPPSPLSHWVDLHSAEDSKGGHFSDANVLIPEEPPMPLSHWIDLRAIENYEGPVPEVAPDPTSIFLELYPLENLSAVETAAKEEVQNHPGSGNLEAGSFASSSINQALADSTSQNVPGMIPDEPPSPLSHWIDLHPIEGAEADYPGHEHELIPEEPAVPLSYWIDLRPIEYYGPLVPEIAAEPTSVFLELHTLGDSLTPSIPPSPAEATLELHESHD